MRRRSLFVCRKIATLILIFCFFLVYLGQIEKVFSEQITIRLRIGDKKILYNGGEKMLDIAPLIQNSRTFVPIRFIAESFGAEVIWKEDPDNSGEGMIKLLFTNLDKSTLLIKMHTNLKIVLIETKSGKESIPEVKSATLDEPPFVKRPENRTLIPLRFISEQLLAKVTWFPETKEILIEKDTLPKLLVVKKLRGNHPEVEWEKYFGNQFEMIGSFIQQTVDGGFILTGTSSSADTTQIVVIKLNPSGEKIWENFYKKDKLNFGVAIYQTPDTGYLLFGNTMNQNENTMDLYILKLNTDGLLLWDKTLGESGDDQVFSVKPTTDGGFILCGQTQVSIDQEEDAFLIKMDTSGNVEWKRFFGEGKPDVAKDCIQTEEDGFAFVGTTVNQNGNLSIMLVKTDAYGNLIWQRNFGSKGNFIGNSLTQTPDKGFLICSETDSFSEMEGIYLLKTDTFGAKDWEKYYEGSKSTIGYSVEKTNSGYFMIAGATNLSIDDLLNYSGNANAYLLFVDPYGNKVWDKILGGEGHDAFLKITRTTDLGFIICGRSSSPSKKNLEIFVAKLTSLQEEKPLLTVYPDYINFGILEKKSSKVTSFLTISNDGAQNLMGYLQSVSAWILLSDKTFLIPSFGNLKVLVSLDPSEMEEGSFEGLISISSNGGNQRIKILCTIIDNSPKLFLDPTPLDFGLVKDRVKKTLTLRLHNMGRKNLYGSVFSDSIVISVNPTNFMSNEQSVQITLLPAKLKNGTYKEILKVQTNGGNQDVPILYKTAFPILNIKFCTGSGAAEINGEKKPFDSKNPKVSPFIVNGRTMVPLRFVSEAFGSEIFWDSFTKKIYLKIPNKEIQMVLEVNNPKVLINQQSKTLDVPPMIYENRVYVPIRFIAEGFGAVVSVEKTLGDASCIKIIYEQ